MLSGMAEDGEEQQTSEEQAKRAWLRNRRRRDVFSSSDALGRPGGDRLGQRRNRTGGQGGNPCGAGRASSTSADEDEPRARARTTDDSGRHDRPGAHDSRADDPAQHPPAADGARHHAARSGAGAGALRPISRATAATSSA